MKSVAQTVKEEESEDDPWYGVTPSTTYLLGDSDSVRAGERALYSLSGVTSLSIETRCIMCDNPNSNRAAVEQEQARTAFEEIEAHPYARLSLIVNVLLQST